MEVAGQTAEPYTCFVPARHFRRFGRALSDWFLAKHGNDLPALRSGLHHISKPVYGFGLITEPALQPLIAAGLSCMHRCVVARSMRPRRALNRSGRGAPHREVYRLSVSRWAFSSL